MPARPYLPTSLLRAFVSHLRGLQLSAAEQRQAIELVSAFFGQDHQPQSWSVSSWNKFVALTLRETPEAQQLPTTTDAITQFIQAHPAHQIEVALEKFLLALRSGNCSSSTVRNYRSDIQQFVTFCRSNDVATLLSKDQIEAFARSQAQNGLKPSSVRRKTSSITTFGQWVEQTGLLKHAPITEKVKTEVVETPKTSVAQKKAVSPAPTQPATPAIQLPKLSLSLPSWLKPKAKRAPNVAPNQMTLPEKPQHLSQDTTPHFEEQIQRLRKEIKRRKPETWLTYLNFAMLLLFFIGMGVFGYRQLFRDVPTPLAYPSSPTRPTRMLSFQGRLTDTAQNPITSATNMTFKLFGASSGGSAVWDSGTCSITPDQDGIFSTTLGSSCGSEIDASVFSEDSSIWLEVGVAGETLTPRQPIATVGYALNSETLQGYPITASGAATVNTVVTMDGGGSVVLGETNPEIRAVSGTFTIQGATLLFQTTSNGDIVFDANGTGGTYIRDYVHAPGATVSANYAGGVPLTLKGGPSGTANILSIQNSSSSELAYFDASGNFVTTGTVTATGNINSSGGSIRTNGTDRITNGGNLANIGTTQFNTVTYTWPASGAAADGYILSSTTGNALSWIDPAGASAGSIYWSQSNGLLYPKNSTVDVTFGGQSTASAKFAFTGINSGTPTASVSAGTAGAIYMTADGSLITTAKQSLTLGDANTTTGNIILNGLSYIGSAANGLQITTAGAISDVNANVVIDDVVDLGSAANGINITTAGVISDNNGNVSINDNTDITGNLDVSGTFTAGTSDAFTIDANGIITKIDSVAHTIDDVSGNLTFTSNSNTISLNDNVTFAGTTTLNGVAYTWPGADGSSGQVLATNGSGTLSWTGVATDSNIHWASSNGTIYPKNSTLDLLIGGQSTASAKFKIQNMDTGTPIASLSANSGNIATYIMGDGTLATTNRQSLTIGNSSTYNTTGNVLINSNGQGRVGIGTAAPSTALTVAGADANFVNTAAGQFTLTVQGGEGNSGIIELRGDDGDNSVDITTITQADGGPFSIKTTNSTVDALTILAAGNVGLGDTTPAAMFTVGSGDLFQVNSSGIIAAIDGVAHTIDDVSGNLTLTSNSNTISLNDNVTFAGTTTLNGATYTWPADDGDNGQVLTSNGTGSLSWTTVANSSQLYWGQANGTLYPFNSTVDLLIGGQSTASAKFAVLNMNTGTPVATISANSGNNAAYLTGLGNLGTTNKQSLTIGGASTGNIIFQPNGDTDDYLSLLSDGTDLTLSGAGNPNFTISNLNNITIDSGNTIAINSSNGITLEDGNSGITLTDTATTYATFSQLGTADLVINSPGGNIVLASGDVLNVGTGNVAAYNFFASTIAGVSTPDGVGDLYIEDELEVDGTTRFGNLTYTWPTTIDGNNYVLTAQTNGTLSWTAVATANQLHWGTANGTLYPFNSTLDLLIGGQSTASAKFKIQNMDTGTPIASLSANSGNIATYIMGDGTLATTNRQTLTIGNSTSYDTTGNVLINSNGTGRVGIGTTTPLATLDVAGTASISSALTVQSSIRPSGNTGLDLILQYKAGANTWANGLVLSNATGNVGIGTTNPGAKLHVVGDIFAPIATFSANYAGGTALTLRGGPSGTANILNLTNSSGTSLSVFDENGLLGIGQTNPNAGIEVLRTTEQLRLAYDASNYGAFTTSSTGDLVLNLTGGGSVEQLVLADTDVLNIGSGSNNLDVAYNIISNSGTSSVVGLDDNDLYVEGNIDVGGTVYIAGQPLNSTSAFWENTNNVFHPAHEFADVVDVVIGGTSTASASIRLGATDGYVYSSRFVDRENETYFVDPAAGGTGLLLAGNAIIEGTASVSSTLTMNGAIRPANGNLTLQYKSGVNSWTNALTINTVGYVGIGTSIPTSELTVAGGASISGTSAHSLTLGDDTWGGVIRPAANKDLTFQYKSGANAWTDLMYLSNGSGSVGIGVPNPQAKLDVNGTASIAGTLTISQVIRPNTNNDLIFQYKSGANAWTNLIHLSNGSGNVGIGIANPLAKLHVSGTASVSSTLTMGGAIQPTTGNLSFNYKSGANAYTTAMTIDTVGNVGIGTTTPRTLLDLTKSASGALGPELQLRNSGNGVSDAMAITFRSGSDDRAQIRSTVESSPFNGTLEFYTGLTSLTERMRIQGDGDIAMDTNTFFMDATNNRVGILNTAPAVALDITGSASASSNIVVGGTIRPADDRLIFQYKSGANAWTNAMAISTVGTVGIGTIAPAANMQLDVNGRVQIDLAGTQTDTALCGSHANGGGASASNVEIVDCTGTPAADYMEFYPIGDDSTLGDIVMVGLDSVTTKDGDRVNKLVKTTTSYQTNMIGVVSDKAKAGDFNSIGYNIKDEDNPQPIALKGRVPVKVTLDNGSIKAGDPVTTSSRPGVGMKATQAGQVIGYALEDYNGQGADANGVGKVMVFINTGHYQPDPLSTLSLSEDGEVTLAQDLSGVYQLRRQDGSNVSRVGHFAEVVAARFEAGMAKAQEVIAEIRVRTPRVETDVISPVATNDLTVELGAATPTDTANFQIKNAENQTVFKVDNQGNTSLLGQLNAQDASISGTVTTDTVQAESARIALLEGRVAEFERLKAQTAELVTATVSGTLYADDIYGFDDKVAASLQKPSLLGQILDQQSGDATTSASVAKLFQVVDEAGYTASGAASLNLSTADLNLGAEDISISASAAFINQYFEVNGTAYVSDSLGVQNRLLVSDGLVIDDNGITQLATTNNPEATLRIQANGQGRIDFLAGVMTIDQGGQVVITGDLRVAGSVTAEESLLTNLIKPTDFTNPLQVQVAGVATESGAIQESRFEIVNELGTPVATISAQGRANFAGGIGVGAEDLSGDASGNVTANQTSGKAVVAAGTAGVTINSSQVKVTSQIYVTPVGSTGNQVMYVKSQADGSFVVGFDNAAPTNVQFNWWLVN